MSTTYDLTARRRPTPRTWLALAASAIAVVVLLVLVAVACRGAGSEPSLAGDPTTPDPGTSAGVVDEAGAGGQDDGGDAGAGTGDAGGSGSNDGGGDDGGDDGGDGGDDGGDDGGGAAAEPSAKDCLSYDAGSVSVEAAGADWRVKVGSSSFKLFATEQEAEDAALVVRHHTHRCFIGRDNDREDRSRYIVHYFEGVSDLPAMPMPQHDCISYDRPNLGVSHHAGDWWLLDGPAELLPLASEADAERARLVAGEHNRLCYIGRGNDRPDHDRYTMSYWLD